MSYEAIYDGVRYPLADAAAAHGLEEAIRASSQTTATADSSVSSARTRRFAC